MAREKERMIVQMFGAVDGRKGVLNGSPGPWLQYGLALATVVIHEVNQQIKDPSFSSFVSPTLCKANF